MLRERRNMNRPEKRNASWLSWMSPLRITLLAINAVCFGGCVVLLAVGTANSPLVLLTTGTGISMAAGLAGAIFASRKQVPGR
jgi:hypothetical protein